MADQTQRYTNALASNANNSAVRQTKSKIQHPGDITHTAQSSHCIALAAVLRRHNTGLFSTKAQLLGYSRHLLISYLLCLYRSTTTCSVFAVAVTQNEYSPLEHAD